MANGQMNHVVRHLRKLVDAERADTLTDGQLLERFATQHEEAAFEALLHRHGPLVLGVCRRVLHDPHEAEDAFQATFLVLARKAPSLDRRGSVGNWLYTVAYHLALKARVAAGRWRVPSSPPSDLASADPLAEITGRELLSALDEELGRLPEKFRAPLVLCYLEGRTRDEAAHQLGWSPGAVKGRLERGRDLLRSRLARRGLAFSAALLPTVLLDNAAAATVPAPLAAATVKAAVGFTGGSAATATGVSAKVVMLAETVQRAMFLAKLKVGLALVLSLTLVAAGAGLVGHRLLTGKREGAGAPPRTEAVEQPRRAERPTPRDQYGDLLPVDALARMGTVRFRHGGEVKAVALSPDGTLAASGGADGIRLWETATGKELHHCEGIQEVNGLALFPNGKTLLSANNGHKAVRLWDVATGTLLREISKEEIWAECLALSRDGTVVAAGSRSGEIRLWDVATGKQLHELKGHPTWVGSLAFAPDGKTLASGSHDWSLRLWEVATGKELRQFHGHKTAVNAVAFSPDGKTLASGGGGLDAAVRLWDVATGRELRQLPGHDVGVVSVAFAPDGKLLASGGMDASIRLWDPATGKEVRHVQGHWGSAVAFSHDGKVLITGGGDAAVCLWDIATGKELSASAGHQGDVSCVAYSPGGGLLASAGADHTIRLWLAHSGKEVRQLKGHQDRITGLAFAPDGKTLLSSCLDKTARLWNPATGAEIRQFHGHDRGIWSAAFDPAGKRVLTGSADGSARLWDVATGKEIRRLVGPHKEIFSVAFSPDGKLVATGSDGDTLIHVWDAATGNVVHRFVSPKDPESVGLGRITVLAFSPDGHTLASASLDKKVQLWDLSTGKSTRRLAVTNWASALSFSPDGKTLATAGPLRLWEVATGKERRRLDGHRGGVEAVAFAPDGKTLASGSYDTTVLVWDVTGLLSRGRPRDTLFSERELENLWAALAGDDAVLAYRAIWALAAVPGQAVPLLQQHVQPVAPLEAQRIARLLRDLDSNRFAVREKATQELQELAERAAPALHKALAGPLGAEGRRRVAGLLAWLPETMPSGHELRSLRAIEVLEQIATPEARQVLQRLSNGAPEARLTREARAALQRLASSER
jgi:RNA polymerase sigma factor (sigma-70 family)